MGGDYNRNVYTHEKFICFHLSAQFQLALDSNLPVLRTMLKVRETVSSRKPSLLRLNGKKVPGDNYIHSIKERKRKRKIVNYTRAGGLLMIN